MTRLKVFSLQPATESTPQIGLKPSSGSGADSKVLRRIGRNERVESAGPMARRLSVRMPLVIEQLIFVSNRAGPVIAAEHAWAGGVQALFDRIDDARIAARRDTPLETELKIRELFRRQELASAGFRPPENGVS